MNDEFSPRMKQMTRTSGWVIPAILIACIAAACLLGGLGLKAASSGRASTQEAVLFDVYNTEEVYSYLEGQFLSDAFASDFKETNHFYFVFDQEFVPFIVQIHGDLSEDQLAVQEYLYGDADSVMPEPATLYGMPAAIQEDIRQFAIESYNEMFGEDLITEENFSDYFGDYYLDTTKEPKAPLPDVVGFLFLAAVLLGILDAWMVIWKISKTKTTRATLAAWPKEKLLLVDGQLSQPSTAAYEAEKLYLTRNYVVSGADGLEILPYQSIIRIYETSQGSLHRVMAETADHTNHILVLLKGRTQERRARAAELLNCLNRKLEEFREAEMVGTQDSASAAEYTEDPIQSQAAQTVPRQSSNLLLGLIGALLGSLVGVVLWVLIGQVGFIAGIAGFVMLKFALSGYRKLGHGLDKKGALLCLVITAFMIFGANMLDYAVSMTRAYFQYEASLETLTFVFGNFTRLMTELDEWSGFMVDLAIGYGLSIWSSFSLIKAILTSK